MRAPWKSSLALSVALLTSSVHGGDGVKLPVAAVGSSDSIAQAGPVGQKPAAPPATLGKPAATLDRPRPLAELAPSPVNDPLVRPTAFGRPAGDLAPVVRGASPESPTFRPMPVGTSADTPAPGAHTWKPAGPPTELAPQSPQAPHAPGMPAPAMPFPAMGGGMPEGMPCADDCWGGCGRGWNLFGSFRDRFGGGCCATSCENVDGCFSDGCPTCGGCCDSSRFYVGAEYLLWFVRGDGVPALVTMGSPGDPIPGALGQAGTQVLFGNNNLSEGGRSGVRLYGGYWFGPCHRLGLDLGYFSLGTQNENYSNFSTGSPILARPFFNPDGSANREEVATPGRLRGGVTVDHSSELWGAEANLRTNIGCGPCLTWDGILGYRTLSLRESLTIQENLLATSLNPLAAAAAPGTTIVVNDSFATRNQFHGGQIGSVLRYKSGRWVFDLTGKIGLGVTQQTVHVQGSTTTGSIFAGNPGFPAGTTTASGGLLALDTNIGRYRRDVFTWVPEAGLKVGYQFSDRWTGFVGYNFLYWSNVARPGAQIDTTVDPRNIPPRVAGGTNRPAFQFNGRDLWVQGLDLGLEYKY